MSFNHLAVKVNCVIWRNIELPYVSRTLNSPIFSLDGLNFYIQVRSTCYEKHNNHGYKIGFTQAWTFKMNCSDDESKPVDCLIIPYAKTAGKYVHLHPTTDNFTITEGTLAERIGSNSLTITMLFLISQCSFNPELNFEGSENVEENYSGEESVQTMCLKGLSENIGNLFNSDEYADAILVCGEKSFSAHRNILTARSEVFAKMFKHDMVEKKNGKVDIVDIDSDVLEQFLHYIYSGKVRQLSMETAFQLYQAGEKYLVKSLKKFCASYIVDNMSKDIVYEVLLLADKANDAEILDRAAAYTAKIDGIFKSPEWKDFAEKYPKVALKVFFKYHA